MFFFHKEPKAKFKNFVNKEPFWMWIKEVDQKDSFKEKNKFLCCVSISTIRKRDTTYYELLLDSIEERFFDEKLLEIENCNEKVYDFGTTITSQKKPKYTRRGRGSGLKIVSKKMDKTIVANNTASM